MPRAKIIGFVSMWCSGRSDTTDVSTHVVARTPKRSLGAYNRQRFRNKLRHTIRYSFLFRRCAELTSPLVLQMFAESSKLLRGVPSSDDGQLHRQPIPSYEVVVVDHSRALATLASELDTLALDCIEANPFYESWMLIPGLNHFATGDDQIVMVRHPRDGITGLFPFQLKQKVRGLPARSLQSWRHPYCFLCTPIVSRRHGQATIRALFDWLESNRAPASIVEFELVAGDGPFWKLLSDELRARPRWRTHVAMYERAALVSPKDTWAAISGRHRKELRRLERRLGESGRCEFRALRNDEPIQPWVEAFLELEAQGWKGRAGTALGSDASSRHFFTDVATRAAKGNHVRMLAIEMDGIPIAMKCNFVSSNSAFAFKIAYDERFSKYSPGVLLELFNMRNFVEGNDGVLSMDSCAVPGHFMINRLWTGRRTLVTCLMARRVPGSLLVHHWALLRRLNSGLSKWFKRRG